jgi:hypothetical protein
MDRPLMPFTFPEYYTAYCEYIEGGEHKFIASDTPIYSREVAEEIARCYFDKPNVIRVWLNHRLSCGAVDIIPVRKKEKDNG